MNKQFKIVDGKKVNTKIEWTDYTSNPIGGCYHRCRWIMPDGTEAICYAENTAEHSRADKFYPQGFESYYWKPNELNAWRSTKTPSRIFCDSMSDMFGHWIIQDHLPDLQAVIQAMFDAHWHTFQILTKNAPGYLNSNVALPQNAWFGVSSPPDSMWGHPLNHKSQVAMLERALKVLNMIAEKPRITWLSAEPLSWDIVPVLEQYPNALKWVVIGAASNGPKYYPPDETHVRRLVEWCDSLQIPVFYKGNMSSLAWAKANWRENFPCSLA